MDIGGVTYIMTNKNNTVLYVGVTSNLKERVWKHKNKFYQNSFTSKYKCDKLVYYQFFVTIEEAILFEKKLKSGSRLSKMKLIETQNPNWNDLFSLLE